METISTALFKSEFTGSLTNLTGECQYNRAGARLSMRIWQADFLSASVARCSGTGVVGVVVCDSTRTFEYEAVVPSRKRMLVGWLLSYSAVNSYRM